MMQTTTDLFWLRLPSDDAEMLSWADRWDALAVSAPQRLPMLSHAWVDAYAQSLALSGGEVHCAIVRRGDDLLAVLPIVVRQECGLSFATTPYDDHTAFGDALLAADATDDTLARLLDAVRARFGVRLAEVAFRGVSADSATPDLTRNGVRGFKCIDSTRSLGSYVRTHPDTWGDYRGRLSKNFRQNLRKAENRLRHSGITARYEHLAAESAAPDHLGTFLALEASGWKGLRGTAIGQDPARLAFYKPLVTNLHERGWLEWHLMYASDAVVAAQLAVRMGRSLVVLKIAYDEGHARFSPGTLLFERTLERCFADENTDEINCLTDMAWHKPWLMQQREYLDHRYYPTTMIGIVAGLAPRVAYRVLRRHTGRGRGSQPIARKADN